VDDWHFPAEERAELAAAGQLWIVSVDAASNSSGKIHLSVGSAPVESLGVGDTARSGWQLRSFIVGAGLGPPIAVLEHDWSRWGSLLFVQPSITAEEGLQQLGECELVAAPTLCFVARKGVGRTSALRRPRYVLEAVDRDYFDKARDSPTDYLRERMCETTDGEPTFASAASLLPPSRDYAMVGNSVAHTKFSVSADGRVKSGNHSIYTPMEQADVTNGADGSELLWDPRNHTAWWPVYNFSEYKSAVVGRTSRAVTVSAWDTTARRGFALMATPNTRRGIQKGGDGAAYDPAEILLRLEDVSGAAAAGEQRETPRYFAVQDCGMGKTSLCRTPQQRTLPDPAEFYAHLLHHTLGWNIFHGEVKPARQLGLGAAPMQLQLGGENASGEGTRLVDMSRAVISAGMTMYLGMRPNYGDGSIYWSVTAHDAGSLPLITAALDRALLLWGHPLAAATRVEFYLNTYVRNSSGLTPENHAGMTRNSLYEKDGRGPPGSLDFKQWGCGHGPGGEVMPHNFQDSLADYGQLIELWVDLARAMEQEPGGAAWVERTWPQLQQLANFTLHLHDEAIDAKHPFPAEGLLVGPAEHDTCAYYGPFFSINAWTWRGWKMLRGFVLDTDAALPGADDAYAAMLGPRIATLARAIEAAVSVSLVRKDRKAFFLPPYAVVNATPYSSMIERGEQGSSGASSYTNFRYWAEMLSSGFFSPEISHAISDFRETHTGTLSGMTRFLDHLDDMPAEGYAYSAMDLARVDSFQALLFGHAANYHSRGVFNAPEQMSLYGDGVKGLWTYSDSYRAYLSSGITGSSDVDIDFCLPSTTLPATMVRWMMLFEERDHDVLALFRATPRRFFTPGDDAAIELAGGTTRYGTVDANVTVKPAAGLEECPEAATASLLLRLHGRGFVSSANRTLDIEVRLRTHGACNGSRHLKSATVCAGGGNMTKFNCHPHAAFDVDKSSETVTVRLPVSVSRQSYRLTIDGHYASGFGSGNAVKTDDPLDAASAAASSNLQYCYINSAIACPKRGPVLPVASDTCCVNWHSPSGFGCGASVSAALVNASQGCGDGFPANTTAVCCKPGPSDPPSKTLPNVLVLGDSEVVTIRLSALASPQRHGLIVTGHFASASIIKTDDESTSAAVPQITYTQLKGITTGDTLRLKRCTVNITCPGTPTCCYNPHGSHRGRGLFCAILALEEACRTTPGCAGFDTDGWLKASVSGPRVHGTSIDTYVGSEKVPGTFPPPQPLPSPHPHPPGPPSPPSPPGPPAPPAPSHTNVTAVVDEDHTDHIKIGSFLQVNVGWGNCTTDICTRAELTEAGVFTRCFEACKAHLDCALWMIGPAYVHGRSAPNCWLMPGYGERQLNLGYFSMCTSVAVDGSCHKVPKPKLPTFVCNRSQCIPGTGHFSYTDADCFGQCASINISGIGKTSRYQSINQTKAAPATLARTHQPRPNPQLPTVLSPARFRPLPVGAVVPAGWLLVQLKLQAEGLSGHLAMFWPDVARSMWLNGANVSNLSPCAVFARAPGREQILSTEGGVYRLAPASSTRQPDTVHTTPAVGSWRPHGQPQRGWTLY
jgi:hypothetical protein